MSWFRKSKESQADKDIDLAVLHILNPQFHCSNIAVEIGMASQGSIDHERALIAKYRTWLETQTDKALIKAYKHWFDHFEYNLEGAQKALDTHAREKWEASSRESMKKFNRVAELAKKLPSPR
jgi:hypothetical protein